MEAIDITEKLEEFEHHISEPDVDRTIFSAKFGDGKTTFFRAFMSKYKDCYDFYTLYPVNYQISSNDQVMDYIKRDILFQMILNGKISPDIELPDSVLFQWYISGNLLSIVEEIATIAPSLLSDTNEFSKVLKFFVKLIGKAKSQINKYSEFEKKIREMDDFDKSVKIIEDFSAGKGNIYEIDAITYLISSKIISQSKPSVLIIEDLDRIDPAHLFRIMNVFSAHLDRKYLVSTYEVKTKDKLNHIDQLKNKFGFAKVIFVMDADGTNSVFKHFYGDSNTNYKGYISKFISKRIFYYSIREFAFEKLESHLKSNCNTDLATLKRGEDKLGIKVSELSIRDIAKVFR